MPKVIRIELPEGREAMGWVWPNDSLRGHATYRSRWLEDFRERWHRALVDERWNYSARLEAAIRLGTLYEEKIECTALK